MTAAEKLEQAMTKRPDSFVPGRTLLTLLGHRPPEDDQPLKWNHAMHWTTGAVVGGLRGVWAATGIRGSDAHLLHLGVRLAFDQTLENATGAGAPPTEWPRSERLIDLTHKAVWAVVTGVVADRLAKPAAASDRGNVSH